MAACGPWSRLAWALTVALCVVVSWRGCARAGCTPYGTPPGGQELCTLEARPGAVCNDGTPGVYYLRRAEPDSGDWLFYLQGGSECNSDATCAARLAHSPQLTTSAGWEPQLQGILSPDPSVNPLLYRVNVVEVHYCSSDYWSGSKTASVAFGTGAPGVSWNFRGRAIAVAALRDLLAQGAATRFSRARRVLFAGSSAGALGVTITLHDLLPLLPADAQPLLAVDAGYALEIGGFDPDDPDDMSDRWPLEAMVATGIAYWHGHGDTPCWQAATTTRQRIQCYNSARLLSDGSITQPSFTAQAQLDTAQLRADRYDTGNMRNAAHATYAAEFACAMQHALRSSRRSNSVYAPQRFGHELFVGNTSFTAANPFPGVPGGTLSPAAALADWLAHPGERAINVGDAMGIQCPPPRG